MAHRALQKASEQGREFPGLFTFAIARSLLFGGLYAFSGARLVARLPLLKPAHSTSLQSLGTLRATRVVAGELFASSV